MHHSNPCPTSRSCDGRRTDYVDLAGYAQPGPADSYLGSRMNNPIDPTNRTLERFWVAQFSFGRLHLKSHQWTGIGRGSAQCPHSIATGKQLTYDVITNQARGPG